MAYRYYNINDSGAPKDGEPLPNGFVRVTTTESYQQLRERELALHRLMIEVFAMHNGSATISQSDTASPTPAPLTRSQTRLLEDLRDMCTISAAATEVEMLAAATNPVLQRVAASGVASARAAFFDGVDDIPLDAPLYLGLANINAAATDDGGRIAVSGKVLSNSNVGVNALQAARPISPTPRAVTTSDPNDPLSLYSADVEAIHKEVLGLAAEMVSDKTTEARRAEVLAILKEKEKLLRGLLGSN